jgi:leucyl-tRNA synthetase
VDLFAAVHRRGLAYQALAPVNWCASCQTTLANEEVEGGTCWRCHQPVQRRDLKQWFLRITAYADELLAETERLDWPEHILAMQRHWIGRSEGVEFEMPVAGQPGTSLSRSLPRGRHGLWHDLCRPGPGAPPGGADRDHPGAAGEVEAYVRRAPGPDRGRAPEHRAPRDGVFTGAYAINPVNGRPVPIFVADYVLMGYGTGAIMAVPAHDQRDFDFARRYGLPSCRSSSPRAVGRPALQAYEGEGGWSTPAPSTACTRPRPAGHRRLDGGRRATGRRAVQYRCATG